MAIKDYFFSLILLVALVIKHSQGLTSLDCVEELPPFIDQGFFSPLLLVGIQALIPAYRISCNGSLTRWKVATVREGQHNIHLQVWRPDLEGNSYSIVGSNKFNLKPTKKQRLFTLRPSHEDQIRVRAGDVLGFYLEKNNSNDFSVQYQAGQSGVSVLYRQVSETIDTINHYTLPVELLNAAPIIQAEIEVTGPEAEMTTTLSPPTSDPTNTITESTTEGRERDPPTIVLGPNPTTDPGDDTWSLVISSVLAITLGVICLLLAAVALVIGCKKKKGDQDCKKKLNEVGLEDEDYEYTRAVIIPPPSFRTHTNMMLIAVPLKNNPIYEPLTPLVHEYETPILLSPRRSHVSLSTGYDVPRGHHDYENV